MPEVEPRPPQPRSSNITAGVWVLAFALAVVGITLVSAFAAYSVLASHRIWVTTYDKYKEQPNEVHVVNLNSTVLPGPHPMMMCTGLSCLREYR